MYFLKFNLKVQERNWKLFKTFVPVLQLRLRVVFPVLVAKRQVQKTPEMIQLFLTQRVLIVQDGASVPHSTRGRDQEVVIVLILRRLLYW